MRVDALLQRMSRLDNWQSLLVPSAKNAEAEESPLIAMANLETELKRGVVKIDVSKVERLLATVYRGQAEVIDPNKPSLFILWREFKLHHHPLFGEAHAMLVARKMLELQQRVGAVICVADSATWLQPFFQKFFPQSQFPLCFKTPPACDVDLADTRQINSLTYTKRDPDGNRLPVDLTLQNFDVNTGKVVVAEDVLASGASGELFLEGLRMMGVGRDQAVVTAPVIMPQGGRQRLEMHPLTQLVYAPIEVETVTGVGMNQIKTRDKN